MENEGLKRDVAERDDALEMAARDRDAYKDMLIEHGLWAEAKEVEELPEELPIVNIVGGECGEITPHPSEELTPSPQGEGFGGEIAAEEPFKEDKNEGY